MDVLWLSANVLAGLVQGLVEGCLLGLECLGWIWWGVGDFEALWGTFRREWLFVDWGGGSWVGFDGLPVLWTHLSAQIWVEGFADELVCLDGFLVGKVLFFLWVYGFWLFGFILFKSLEKVSVMIPFIVTFLLIAIILDRLIMHRLDIFDIISRNIQRNIIHLISLNLNFLTLLNIQILSDKIATIRPYFLNIRQWNPLLFAVLFIFRHIHRRFDLILVEIHFLFMVVLCRAKMIIGQVSTEGVFTEHVTVGETVTNGLVGLMGFGVVWLLEVCGVAEGCVLLVAECVVVLACGGVVVVAERVLGWMLLVGNRLVFGAVGQLLQHWRCSTLVLGLLDAWNVTLDHVSHLFLPPLLFKCISSLIARPYIDIAFDSNPRAGNQHFLTLLLFIRHSLDRFKRDGFLFFHFFLPLDFLLSFQLFLFFNFPLSFNLLLFL